MLSTSYKTRLPANFSWPVRLGELQAALPSLNITVIFSGYRLHLKEWPSCDRNIVSLNWQPHVRGIGCNWQEHWRLSVDPIPSAMAGELRPAIVTELHHLAQAAMKMRPDSWRYHPHALVISWIASEQQVRFSET